ncbi:MAG: hypothetical protein ABIS47_13360, partial [Acidimicrobiales bacterium]
DFMLDLSRIPLGSTGSRRVVARVGAGRLTVIVPAMTATGARARVGAGTASLFGQEQSGAGGDVSASHPGVEGTAGLDLDLKVGVGEVQVVLAEEPTFGVSCQVPEDVTAAAPGPVTCPHPARLVKSAMTCSVTLADPDGQPAGRGFCRRLGSPAPPAPGDFATTCTVGSEDDIATCGGLGPLQLDRLQKIRTGAPATPSTRPGDPGPAPTAPPTPTTPPAPGAPPTPTAGPGSGVPLTCGPADAAGTRTCTPVPTSTTATTAPASFRCTEASGTTELTCVPA